MSDPKKVILCVDDDQDTLDVLRIALESGGYRVLEARTAEDGLRQYKAHRPDLLIVDLMMEEVDSGTSFVTRVRALGGKAPIYMLSSVGDTFIRQVDSSELGLAGVFQKPIEPQSLLLAVRTKLPPTT